MSGLGFGSLLVRVCVAPPASRLRHISNFVTTLDGIYPLGMITNDTIVEGPTLKITIYYVYSDLHTSWGAMIDFSPYIVPPLIYVSYRTKPG